MIPERIAPRSRMVRGRAAATLELADAAHDVLAASPYAMTLRQLYYALISTGALPKVEAAYGRLKRVMRELREDGTVPWEWLVDHTRSVFQARTWEGLAGLLADSARLYRRDLMRSQPVAIQLWAESDSIGSVIARTADRYTIPTFIGRGYSARGYLWARRPGCRAGPPSRQAGAHPARRRPRPLGRGHLPRRIGDAAPVCHRRRDGTAGRARQGLARPSG